MQSASFIPVHVGQLQSTGMLPQKGDSFVGGKKLLYPSPAAGRGSRIFLAVHVTVHVLTLLLTGILMGTAINDVSGEVMDGSVVLAFIAHLLGTVCILGVSSMSTKPFENGLFIALIVWLYLASLSFLGVATALAYGSLNTEHHVVVWCVLSLLSATFGVAMVIAGTVSGLASSSKINAVEAAAPITTPLVQS